MLASCGFALHPALGQSSDSPSQPATNPSTQVSPATQELAGLKLIDPRSFGFQATPDYVQVPADSRVLVEEQGKVVVGRVHAQVGDSFILLLPDGRLVDRKATQVQTTDRPFEPLKSDELAASLRVGRFANFNVLKSKNYVLLYNTSEEYAQATKRILERMLSGVIAYTKRLGFKPHEPLFPQVVIMFGSYEEFRAYRDMPRYVMAYYNVVGNEIVLFEEQPGPNGEREFAIGQAISTIAHEGAHQILHNIGIQQRLSVWPMWVNEGFAEYLAPTSFGKNMGWKGAGVVNDYRMFELESYIQGRSFHGLDGTTVEKTVSAQQLDSTGYASAWATVHFLAKKREDEFAEYLKMLSTIQPLQGMVASPNEPVAANLQYFRQLFSEDLPSFEQELVDHLGNQRYVSPVAAYPHYAALIEFREGRKSVRRGGFFFDQKRADQWLQDYLALLDEPQRAEASYRIVPCANREQATTEVSRWRN